MAVPHAKTTPAIHSFLQYDQPVKMAEDEPDPPKEKSLEWLKFWLFRTSDMRYIPDPRLVEYVTDYSKCKRKEAPAVRNTATFLETLFPTKYWTDNGQRFKQKVSSTQATRPALIKMSKRLDSEMERRQASKGSSKSGYCPIRYTLHLELFDELIRQVTLECPFRGYLLNRVRGELYVTLDAYKTLLQTSVAEDVKMESADMNDPEMVSLRNRVSTLEGELQAVQMERFGVGCDFKEISDKMDLLDRIRTQLYEPEIKFTKRIQHAMERQLYHFENPPSLEEEQLEDVIHI